MNILWIIPVTIIFFSTSPISISISILFISILITPPLYNTENSIWLPLILVITFSSGMMTLFAYTASLAPNNNTNTQPNLFGVGAAFLAISSLPLSNSQNNIEEGINNFSSSITIIVITVLIILSMLAITSHTNNPHQTILSTF